MATMSEQDVQEQHAEVTPTPEHQPKKAGSGYRRLQNRHRALIAEHEELKLYADTLRTELAQKDAALRQKCEEMEALCSMYATLQEDVSRVLTENEKLVALLRSAPQPQPAYPPQPTYQPQPRLAVPPGLPSLFSRGPR